MFRLRWWASRDKSRHIIATRRLREGRASPQTVSPYHSQAHLARRLSNPLSRSAPGLPEAPDG
jgi:hypothetical protein